MAPVLYQCTVCLNHYKIKPDGKLYRHGGKVKGQECPGSFKAADQPPAGSSTSARPPLTAAPVINPHVATRGSSASVSESPSQVDFFHVFDRLTVVLRTAHLYDHVPKPCRDKVSKALSALLTAVCDDPCDAAYWCRLQCFFAFVLFKPTRGGRRTNQANYVIKRLAEFSSTEVEFIVASFNTDHNTKPRKHNPNSWISAVTTRIEQGSLSAAEPSNGRVSPAQVLTALKSFNNGSSGGLDGLRPQHIKDLLSGPTPTDELLNNLTRIHNRSSSTTSSTTTSSTTVLKIFSVTSGPSATASLLLDASSSISTSASTTATSTNFETIANKVELPACGNFSILKHATTLSPTNCNNENNNSNKRVRFALDTNTNILSDKSYNNKCNISNNKTSRNNNCSSINNVTKMSTLATNKQISSTKLESAMRTAIATNHATTLSATTNDPAVKYITKETSSATNSTTNLPMIESRTTARTSQPTIETTSVVWQPLSVNIRQVNDRKCLTPGEEINLFNVNSASDYLCNQEHFNYCNNENQNELSNSNSDYNKTNNNDVNVCFEAEDVLNEQPNNNNIIVNENDQTLNDEDEEEEEKGEEERGKEDDDEATALRLVRLSEAYEELCHKTISMMFSESHNSSDYDTARCSKYEYFRTSSSYQSCEQVSVENDDEVFHENKQLTSIPPPPPPTAAAATTAAATVAVPDETCAVQQTRNETVENLNETKDEFCKYPTNSTQHEENNAYNESPNNNHAPSNYFLPNFNNSTDKNVNSSFQSTIINIPDFFPPRFPPTSTKKNNCVPLKTQCEGSVERLKRALIFFTILSCIRNLGCYLFVCSLMAMICIHPQPVFESRPDYTFDLALLLCTSFMFMWQVLHVTRQLLNYSAGPLHDILLVGTINWKEMKNFLMQKRSIPPYVTLEMEVSRRARCLYSLTSCFNGLSRGCVSCINCCCLHNQQTKHKQNRQLHENQEQQNNQRIKYAHVLKFDGWSDDSPTINILDTGGVSINNLPTTSRPPSNQTQHKHNVMHDDQAKTSKTINNLYSTYLIFVWKDYKCIDKQTNSSIEREVMECVEKLSADLHMKPANIKSEIDIDVMEGNYFPDAQAFLVGMKESGGLCGVGTNSKFRPSSLLADKFFTKKCYFISSCISLDGLYSIIFSFLTRRKLELNLTKYIKRSVEA
ncbi:hypothetical protein HELRODRAFT_189170 [Helobdella robusta]|uniref:Uncharacterized protein n=1 Tax=Helobdella robusta TaxID=6412 RepID=T1FQQ9_HELRO|nr:hypothetical protein HELRODRAFT_189170 [Helobdella robusta]ESN96244.1 hypothetical protein HELRODRAFT_189170 [Helobdella robusta]